MDAQTAAAPESATGLTDEATIGGAARGLLATLSAAAGVIHLAMVPGHAGESTVEGIGFAVTGWAQLAFAGAVVLRPSRRLLQAGILGNLAVIGLWVWSRTVGLPVGAHSGEAESVSSIDLLATGMEAVLVVASAALLANPNLGRRLGQAGVVLASALAGMALVATSLALAAPSTRDHGHGESADAHDHGTGADASTVAVAADRCDLGFNPAAYWEETAIAGVDVIGGSSHGATATTGTDGHDHSTTAPAAATPSTTTPIQGSPELDALIAATAQEGGEVKDAQVVVALSDVSDDVYDNWLRWLPTYSSQAHATSSSGAPDDNGGHGGHLGPQPWVAMTDQAQCDQLAAELTRAREVALRYPTAADATAAGWFRVTPYVAGIAAHYMKFSIVDGTFDIDEPEMLLYDGDGPDAAMVGLSYYLIHNSDLEPTQGFTGPNDHFHRHVGLCIGAGGVIGDSTTTAEECAAIGGRKAGGTGGWMNHVWIVPGCESPWGMFSGASPLLDDTLAERSGTDGGACAGSGVRDRYDLAPGSASNTPPSVLGTPSEQAAPTP